MSTRGLYRTKMPEGGAEYACVFHGNPSQRGEIPRPLYEARGYRPRFDTLPAHASNNTNEGDIRGEAYTAIYNSLFVLGLLGPEDESFNDAYERLRKH
jgi:hypothetical protein